MTINSDAARPLSLLSLAVLVTGCADQAVCGNGVIEGAETCDDGNPFPSDGCSSFCEQEPGYDCSADSCEPVCDDGITVAAEVCDPSDPDWDDWCSNDCTMIVGSCGDSVLQPGREECEDGNTTSYDGCSSGCYVDFGFTCDSAVPSNCTATGLPPTQVLSTFSSGDATQYCSWLIDLLGGPGVDYTCGSYIYTTNSVSGCHDSIYYGGWGSEGSCTVADLEAAVARAGNICSVFTVNNIC